MTPEQKAMMQGWIDEPPTRALLTYVNNQRATALQRAIGARRSPDADEMRMELETIHRLNQLFEAITTGSFLPTPQPTPQPTN